MIFCVLIFFERGFGQQRLVDVIAACDEVSNKHHAAQALLSDQNPGRVIVFFGNAERFT